MKAMTFRRCPGRMRLILVFLALFVSLGVSAQKTYVVCVGLNVYDNGENPLPCSTNDARGMAHFFNDNKDADVFMLVDRNATRDHILRVLKSQFGKAGKNDEIVFAYSGHGFDGGLSCYDTRNVIFCREIQDIMRASKAGRKVVFMNACHSGSFKKHTSDSGNRDYRSADSDVMFFVSSRANEYSWERTDMKYSYFFNRLLAGLNGYADADKDKKVTARELFNYVYGGVTSDTRNTGQVQHPQMYGRFPDDMLIVNVR